MSTSLDAARGRHGGSVEERATGRVFVKRVRGSAAVRSIGREAEMLTLLSTADATSVLVPALLEWNDEELTVEAIPGHDLRVIDASHEPIDASTGEAVGAGLAVLHDASDRLIGGAPDCTASAVYRATHPDPGLLRLLSAAGLDLLRVLQRSGALCAHLDRVSATRDREALVHGDLRFENIMREESHGGDRPRIRFVDWEFAGRGDVREDLGAFVASCLDAWLSSVPSVPGVAPERLIASAGRPLGSVAPVIGAFFDAYSRARGADESTLLLRQEALEFAAARLIHLSFEAACETEDLRIDHVLRLQVAANILDDPAAALVRLLPERSDVVVS